MWNDSPYTWLCFELHYEGRVNHLSFMLFTYARRIALFHHTFDAVIETMCKKKRCSR